MIGWRFLSKYNPRSPEQCVDSCENPSPFSARHGQKNLSLDALLQQKGLIRLFSLSERLPCSIKTGPKVTWCLVFSPENGCLRNNSVATSLLPKLFWSFLSQITGKLLSLSPSPTCAVDTVGFHKPNVKVLVTDLSRAKHFLYWTALRILWNSQGVAGILELCSLPILSAPSLPKKPSWSTLNLAFGSSKILSVKWDKSLSKPLSLSFVLPKTSSHWGWTLGEKRGEWEMRKATITDP